jgi:hypothetical protein
VTNIIALDITFDPDAIAAFAALMRAAAANGWQVDYASQLGSADWATLASSTPRRVAGNTLF